MKTKITYQQRGIGDKWIDDAKRFFESNSAGKKIAEMTSEGDIIVCIRRNYFNIYKNGCSLLKYRPSAQEHKFLVHKKYVEKYLERPSNGFSSCYASLNLDGNDAELSLFQSKILNEESPELKEYLYLKNPQGEKKNLHSWIEDHSPWLVDLEVTFAYEGKAKRMDLAYFDQGALCFVEAKVASDSRLKSAKGIPEVESQMKLYEDFLSACKSELANGYKKVVGQYLKDFPYLVPEERRKGFREEVDIDTKPRLLLLATGSKTIQDSLRGANGPNDGDHLQTLRDICNKHEWKLMLG